MKNGVGTFRIAATYIGTVVGAGFASGQEVLQFFSYFGAWGAAGLALVTVLFIFFGMIIMETGRASRARSHMDVLRLSGGKALGRVTDAVITFFLFGSLTAMIAGCGALFEQQLRLPSLLGSGLMAILPAVTVLTGIRGVINSISVVVPFLLGAVAVTCACALYAVPPVPDAAPFPSAANGVISGWLMAAVLYVSYNTLVSAAVLGPLGTQAACARSIKRGALLGGLGLGAAAFLIYLAFSGRIASLYGVEVPMLSLAGGVSGVLQLSYAAVLAAEIFTTAVGSLYGFAARFSDERSPLQSRVVAIAVTVVAFWAAQLGFSNLVRYLYPIAGYGGLLLLALLLWSRIRLRKRASF